MTTAPDHSPKLNRVGLFERIGPYLPMLLVPLIMLAVGAYILMDTASDTLL